MLTADSVGFCLHVVEQREIKLEQVTFRPINPLPEGRGQSLRRGELVS